MCSYNMLLFVILRIVIFSDDLIIPLNFSSINSKKSDNRGWIWLCCYSKQYCKQPNKIFQP